MITSICGTPRGAGGMPVRSNLPRRWLSFVMAHSPSNTCIVTAGLLSWNVVNVCVCLVGIVVFLLNQRYKSKYQNKHMSNFRSHCVYQRRHHTTITVTLLVNQSKLVNCLSIQDINNIKFNHIFIYLLIFSILYFFFAKTFFARKY